MTTFAAVLGFPVRHSRSPAMMNAALRELGLDWRYLALPVPPERFAETVRALPASGYVGVNVTIPHKLAAFALADEPTEVASAIGAANTLSFEDGRIQADNTDAGGLLDALGEPVAGQRALVLGAGGAARAVVWALREAGAEVAVWNRTAARALALAGELGVRIHRPEPARRDREAGSEAGSGPQDGALARDRSDAAQAGGAPGDGTDTPVFDLLVNTTSVGLEPGSSLEDLPLGGLEPAVVVDLVYGVEPTPLEHWARDRGARTVDGLEVLVRQGARSLERWTGQVAPIDTMRDAAARRPPV